VFSLACETRIPGLFRYTAAPDVENTATPRQESNHCSGVEEWIRAEASVMAAALGLHDGIGMRPCMRADRRTRDMFGLAAGCTRTLPQSLWVGSTATEHGLNNSKVLKIGLTIWTPETMVPLECQFFFPIS
jgi:hypothetical protein